MTDSTDPRPEGDPGYASVRKYLLYTLSVPERALRSGAGVVGALRESTGLLVPRAFQSSKTYSVMVQQMLDFLVEDVGGVARVESASASPKVENFVARKAVGNFIEMAGLATLHLSPLTLLAVVNDVAYGSQSYLKELSAELKRHGVIDEQSTIDHVDDLLAAVAGASGTMATAFDTPPLSVDGLRQTIDDTRAAVTRMDPTKVIPQQELDRLWREMRELADREGVGIFDLSSAVTLSALDKIGHAGRGALSTVVVAGRLFDRHVIDHYEEALAKIRDKGFYAALSESSRPYVEAVWTNFAHTRPTLTEDVVSGRMIGAAWRGMRRWIGGGEPTAVPLVDAPPAADPQSAPPAEAVSRRPE